MHKPTLTNAVTRAPRTIDQVLAAARARLQRLTPHEAHDAHTNAAAILVDIRPEAQRTREGSIPGAILIERNVLEWRFDPTSEARLPIATSHDVQVIIFCSEGYTSSLAAASLQDLGLSNATDIIGGFKAWQAAQLPHSSADAHENHQEPPQKSSFFRDTLNALLTPQPAPRDSWPLYLDF